MKTKLIELAGSAIGAIDDLYEQLGKVSSTPPWPYIIMWENQRPALSPLYRLRADWPRVSGWRIEPTFWLRDSSTGRSVRVAFNPRSQFFNIIDWRLP